MDADCRDTAVLLTVGDHKPSYIKKYQILPHILTSRLLHQSRKTYILRELPLAFPFRVRVAFEVVLPLIAPLPSLAQKDEPKRKKSKKDKKKKKYVSTPQRLGHSHSNPRKKKKSKKRKASSSVIAFMISTTQFLTQCRVPTGARIRKRFPLVLISTCTFGLVLIQVSKSSSNFYFFNYKFLAHHTRY